MRTAVPVTKFTARGHGRNITARHFRRESRRKGEQFQCAFMLTINEAVAAALSHTGAVAPAALMLISLGGFLRYKIAASKISVNFQLRKLEAVELDRSMLLYKKVYERRA